MIDIFEKIKKGGEEFCECFTNEKIGHYIRFTKIWFQGQLI